MSFRWLSIILLALFCSILVEILDFSEIQLVCDGPTDRRTDIPSYRDSRTHIKSEKDGKESGKKKKNLLKSREKQKKGSKKEAYF